MSGTKFIGRVATAALLAAGVIASACVAAKAQDSEQQPTVFGAAAPHQYLINRMMAPDRPKNNGAGGQAAGQSANGGQPANGEQAATDDDDNGPNNGAYQMPKRYLLNKMFDFGGAPARGRRRPPRLRRRLPRRPRRLPRKRLESRLTGGILAALAKGQGFGGMSEWVRR